MTASSAPAGFNGKKNIYTCPKCGGHIVTVDTAEGVTPFMIPCEFGCQENMKSSMYRVFDQGMRADYHWYRPSAAEVLPEGYRHHVEQGGLLLRKADGAPTNADVAWARKMGAR